MRVIKIGESGLFDFNSEDFEVEDEDGCFGFSAPDRDGDETNFQVIRKTIMPPSGAAVEEWKKHRGLLKRKN